MNKMLLIFLLACRAAAADPAASQPPARVFEYDDHDLMLLRVSKPAFGQGAYWWDSNLDGQLEDEVAQVVDRECIQTEGHRAWVGYTWDVYTLILLHPNNEHSLGTLELTKVKYGWRAQ